MNKPIFSFGDFELDAERRMLMHAGSRVSLGSRAMELLIALASQPRVMIGGGELTRQVWQDTFVEESNLRVHIAAVRKALREAGYAGEVIENLPGEGYRFALAVKSSRRRDETDTPVFRPPQMLTTLIGRADEAQDLVRDLPRHRLMTIVGTAGIGKTSVALHVGNAIQDVYANGVCFVDLTSIALDVRIASALASAMHLPPVLEDVEGQVCRFVTDKHLLIIFDNCERHLDELSALAESLLAASSKISILATSREALGASGEWVRQLKPLEIPPPHNGPLSAENALVFSAVRLFVERARATSSSFPITEDDAPWIAELCRQMDGLPLAIELAAARVDIVGIRDMAEQLGKSIELLSLGRRTAAPRHRTLAAALDWSYELLAEDEQIVFARLAVFQSQFTRQSALAVAVCEVLTPSRVMDILGNLAAKSMLIIDTQSGTPAYRLLDTTRAYAIEKLGHGPASEMVRRRHAEFLRDEHARDYGILAARDSLRDYRPLLDELRSALRWCFSEAGDALLGIELTITLASKWYAVTLFLEFAAEVQRNIVRLRNEDRLAPDMEIRLLLAFIPALYNTEGPTPQIHQAVARALVLTDDADESHRYPRLQLMKELWLYHNGSGEIEVALSAADEFERLLAGNHDPTFLTQRMRAVSYLDLGDLSQALENITVVLEHPLEIATLDRGIYEYDPQVTALFTQARALWLQGFTSQARRAAQRCVEAALHAQHPASICVATSLASCPIALWCGDRKTAEESLKLLRHQALVCPLPYWQQFGDVFERALGLGTSREEPKSSVWRHCQLQEACVLDGGWVAPELRQHALDGARFWFCPEILRREALHRLETLGDGGLPEAMSLLQRSLRLAKEMGALSWELRTATTIARIDMHRDVAWNHGLLESVVGRFSEGYDTVDYGQAVTVLSEMEDRLARVMHVS
jgi:predicted ATPase/DNA-binding winged helix-turn-helix (wHTH) protein